MYRVTVHRRTLRWVPGPEGPGTLRSAQEFTRKQLGESRMPGAIYAEGLVKTFGDVRALDGVDIDVPEGTVLGMLGPNGAGKTTAVRVLTTLLQPDSGQAVVAGIDVLKNPDEVRRSIGLSGQFAAVDEYLTGRENLQMVGQLYQMGARDAKKRAGSSWRSSTSPTPVTAPRRRTPGHAPPPRPGGRARRLPAGDVHGRAHHRARPAQPAAAVGGHRGARRRMVRRCC